MRFRVLTDDINYGMGMVGRAIAARPVKQAYDGVLIESLDDGLLLTCTDGEMTIKAKIPAMIEEEGCALLPAKLFGDVMRKQPLGEVSVSIDDKSRAVIRSALSKTNMAGMDAEDFPEIADVDTENRVSLPCDQLRLAISRVLFAVSQDEARKILTGVLMEAYPDDTVFVGLDGFRLALERIPAQTNVPAGAKDGMLCCVVPGGVMQEISRMLPDDPEQTADIIFSSSHVMYRFGSVRVYTTLLTGEFIDYRRILPASWTSEVSVARGLLADAIDRCSLIAREGKNNLIHLSLKRSCDAEVDPNATLVMTANAERGDAHEELSIGLIGNELDIAFNARYLTDVVHNTDDDVIVMCFNSNVSPCMTKPVQGEQYRFLVLPVRIFSK